MFNATTLLLSSSEPRSTLCHRPHRSMANFIIMNLLTSSTSESTHSSSRSTTWAKWVWTLPNKNMKKYYNYVTKAPINVSSDFHSTDIIVYKRCIIGGRRQFCMFQCIHDKIQNKITREWMGEEDIEMTIRKKRLIWMGYGVVCTKTAEQSS